MTRFSRLHRCCTVILAHCVLVWGCDGDHVLMAIAAPPVPTESEPEPPRIELPAVGEEESVASGAVPRTQVLAAGALDLLQGQCASCHSNDAEQGGVGDVLNVPELIRRGQLVPGSSGSSPLFTRLSQDRAHASGSLTEGEIALLGRFIDELQAPVTGTCDTAPYLSPDALFATLAADLEQQPAEARPFLRYLSLSYASNAGLCGPALQGQRLALFKLVNSVSTAPEIHVPVPVDPAQLLYRLDLRDYGWNVVMAVNDDSRPNFTDGWLAIAGSVGSYATEWSGTDADVVKAETGARVPVLPGNAFVHAATQGPLYHALIGARALNTDTEAVLGIDVWADASNGHVQRAAFGKTMLLRFEQPKVPDRYYWFMESSHQRESYSVYEDPLDILFEERQTIFHLPNGLFAYSLDDDLGQRMDTASLSCQLAYCRQPPPLNAATCHGCHSDGLLPFRDRLRDYYLDNPIEFNLETGEAILAQYPPEADFNALLEHDSELHRAAAERAGVPRHTPDPISRVFFQFEREPLTLWRAAAELGVTPDVLGARLGELDARLAPLGAPEGSVDRATFSSALGSALCVLHADAVQHPSLCP